MNSVILVRGSVEFAPVDLERPSGNPFAPTEQLQGAIAAGWHLIPVRANKRPVAPWRGAQNRIRTAAELNAWLVGAGEYRTAKGTSRTDGTAAAYAVEPQQHNLMILDLDAKAFPTDPAARAAALELVGRLTKAAGGWWAKSQSGGYHIYYRNPDGRYQTRPQGQAAILDGVGVPWIETKASSGYCVLYALAGGAKTMQQPPPDPPPELVAALDAGSGKRRKPRERAQPASPLAWQGAAITTIEQFVGSDDGDRNNALYRAAVYLRERQVPLDYWVDDLVGEAEQRGLTRTEINATLDSAEAKYPDCPECGNPGEIAAAADEIADLLNADRHGFIGSDTLPNADVLLAGAFVVANPECKIFRVRQPSGNSSKWHQWRAYEWREPDGGGDARWVQRDMLDVEADLRDCWYSLRAQQTDATPSRQKQQRATEAAAAAVAIISRGYTTDMLDAGMERVLLQCGKAYNLRTAQIEQNLPEYYLTRPLPVRWDSKADCSVFAKAITDWFGSDSDMILYVSFLLGCMLLPHFGIQQFWYHYGRGGNGKSTFLNAVRGVLGDWSGTADNQAVVRETHTGSIRDEETSNRQNLNFVGKLLTAVDDTPAECQLNDAALKLYGDTGMILHTRRLYHDAEQSRNYSRLHMVGNGQPQFRVNDEALLDRLRVVHWKHKFRAGAADNISLAAALERERNGIFRLMVISAQTILVTAGADDGQQKDRVMKMYECPAVREAVERMVRRNRNAVAAFWSEEILLDETASITLADMKNRLAQWNRERDFTDEKFLPHTQKLCREIESLSGGRAIYRRSRRDGKLAFRFEGLRWRSDTDADAAAALAAADTHQVSGATIALNAQPPPPLPPEPEPPAPVQASNGQVQLIAPTAAEQRHGKLTAQRKRTAARLAAAQAELDSEPPFAPADSEPEDWGAGSSV